MVGQRHDAHHEDSHLHSPLPCLLYTSCGILLDVNNIYVSSKNHSFDPFTYVNSVPAHRVAQIHIAGHSKFEKYILDTHDHPVLPAVWRLYARAIERCGPTATLLEWDDNIPTFEEVHAEALKATKFLKAAAEAAPNTATAAVQAAAVQAAATTLLEPAGAAR